MKTRFLAAALLCAATATAALAQVPGVTDKEIRIGTFGPVTGVNFVQGRMPMNGLQAVFAKVNEAGGINGRKITLVRMDDTCDPVTAITVVKRLIHNENIFAIVGGSCSNAVLAAKQEIVESGIPYVNFAAASNLISAPKTHNIFTTMLTSTLESNLQAQFLADKGVKRISLVAVKDPWGKDRYDSFTKAAKARGIEIVSDEELDTEANDATPQVVKTMRAGPDHVVLLIYPKAAALFVRDSAKLGFKPTFIATSTVPDPVAFAEQVGIPGATDKFLTIAPTAYAVSSPEMKEWATRLQAMFPDDKTHGFNLYGVAAGRIVEDALKRAGPNLTREGFLSAMEGLTDWTVDVYPGKIDCSDHQCTKTAVWVGRTPEGKLNVVGKTTLK